MKDGDRQLTKKDGSETTEKMDSKDDDIKALTEKWKAMDKKGKRATERHQQKFQTRYQGQQKEEKQEKSKNLGNSSKASSKIANIKSRKEKILISQMETEGDEVEASRKGIANTFAKFNGDLHSSGEPFKTVMTKMEKIQ